VYPAFEHPGIFSKKATNYVLRLKAVKSEDL